MIDVRDIVLIEHRDKALPAIILRVLDNEHIVAVCGTWTKREEPRVAVKANTRDGKSLGFAISTYFYRNNVCRCSIHHLEQTGLKCTPELFMALRRLIER